MSVWLELPIGPFRVSTALTAIALAAVLFWRYRRRPHVAVGVLAWLAAYEVLYIGTGTLIHGWPFSAFLWTCNLAAWVLLAWVIGVRAGIEPLFGVDLLPLLAFPSRDIGRMTA